MMRAEILETLRQRTIPWDVLVIGGGATGLGTAVEAASRGYQTVLVERIDFAKGTSSRSTKLAHGGVRYLEQGNITLVLDALKERGHMLRNAPHLVHDLSFVVPAFHYLSLPYYGLGLKVYERLSGKLSLGPSRFLSRTQTLQMLPGIASDGLRGGVLYHDGQFDDARYAISLMRTLQDLGGTAINYIEATQILHHNGRAAGIAALDKESGESFEILAKVVINATGTYAERVLSMDHAQNRSVLALSQGTHFVLPRSFLEGSAALMVPRTDDGRVLFAIPWHGATIVGTTDEPVEQVTDDPRALRREKEFLLDHINRYFGRRPHGSEILSVWSGQRPLFREASKKTSQISRDHKILVSDSRMITITGGKWTTYRRMGQDAIDRAAGVGSLPATKSRTVDLKLHGWLASPSKNMSEPEFVYGSDFQALEQLGSGDPELNRLIHPNLPYRLREIIWAARYEMARTTEDVLARRTHALFLDARAAIEAAPAVAAWLGKELKRDAAWIQRDLDSFISLANGYVYHDNEPVSHATEIIGTQQ
ncbi:MAG TPA: glycerol-3-phosphate dehydrogenase/oxidase [Acidobacteriaceae bacterium]